MKIIRGRYNEAKVFTDRIEEGAEEQPAKAATAMMRARLKASFFMCLTPYNKEMCGRVWG